MDKPQPAPVPREVRDPARLSKLRRLGLLDTPAEDSFDRISRLAARTIGTPIALVSLVDADRQFFKSCVGLGEPWQSSRQTPLDSSFCKHAVGKKDILVINDAREDPLHRNNKAISNLGAIAYLGHPLVYDDEVIGTLCVIDRKAREWTDDDIRLARDFAALIMSEIELRGHAIKQKEALRDRERMLAVVSHDLKTPVQSMLTALALLELESLSDDAKHSISALRSSASQMHRLITDLLDVSTLEFDKFAVKLDPLDIASLLEDIAYSAAVDAADRGIELRVDTQKTPEVFADRDRLVQVVSNIIDNAMRFTPEGGAIDVVSRWQHPEVKVSILDTGPGIPEADIDNIFDWCWHAGREENSGTGLGLSIAKGVIDAHGGRIWAENRGQGGAAFHFALPVVD